MKTIDTFDSQDWKDFWQELDESDQRSLEAQRKVRDIEDFPTLIKTVGPNAATLKIINDYFDKYHSKR